MSGTEWFCGVQLGGVKLPAEFPAARNSKSMVHAGSVIFFGARIWLGTILGRFSINYFSGLGLRIRVTVWVRVRVSVRVWVRVSIGVGVRVSVVIWSG